MGRTDNKTLEQSKESRNEKKIFPAIHPTRINTDKQAQRNNNANIINKWSNKLNR